MTAQDVIQLLQGTLEIIIILVAVVLMPALGVGLLVSMFQAATQINEMTLSFIPKLLITLLTLVLAGPWMLRLVIDFTSRLIQNIPYVIG